MDKVLFVMLTWLVRVGRQETAFRLCSKWSEPFTRPSQYRAALMFTSAQNVHPKCSSCGWIIFADCEHQCPEVTADELLASDADVSVFAQQLLPEASNEPDLYGDYQEAYSRWTSSLCRADECANKACVDGVCADHLYLGEGYEGSIDAYTYQ